MQNMQYDSMGVIHKVRLLKTSSIWPSPPLFVPVRFTCTPSTYVRFSELTIRPPNSLLWNKVLRRLWIFEWKIGEWKERRELICKLIIKDQCFLHSYI